ncbi:MAG: tRNA modification GTPase, partial [Ignavibacteria bacterium]|nr:tRNA modification GTPase [Ignavibacteria bacterium]
RHADPGEFTRRAFLNNRIDLAQAEAVAELITARSRRAQQQSINHLQGGIRQKTGALREELIRIASLLEIDLDFSEEGIDVVSKDHILEKLTGVAVEIASLEKSFETGRVLRDGVRVAIVGPPNVGKSSLFNALLASERSIVSEEPGTTRDFLEESITISGVLFSLVDTAGQRSAQSRIEAEGVKRSLDLARSSDLILAVADASILQVEGDWEGEESPGEPGKVLVVLNKVDLCNGSPPRVERRGEPVRQVTTSAKTGVGLEELRRELLAMALGSEPLDEIGLVVTNRRHFEVLGRAGKAVRRAVDSARAGMSNEFIALDTREAVAVISEITGEVTSEEILNSVFDQFCVGK